MKSHIYRNNFLLLFASSIIACLVSLSAYFFIFQTQYLNKREIAFFVMILVALIPLIYSILSRSLIPNLRFYSPRSRVCWLLLSFTIGFLAVLAIIDPPFFNLFLPSHSLKVMVPPGNPNRTVTLQWFATSLGDIGFSQLQPEGDWQRTDAGFTHSGSAPASLNWTGHTGDSAQLIFSESSNEGALLIAWDDLQNPIDLSASSSTSIKSLNSFPVHPINRAFVLITLWISVSFLFLALTLFLIHVPVRISPKTRSHFAGLESCLSPLSGFFFPKPGKGWWQGRDWLVLIFFLLLSSLFFLGRWNGLNPFVDLRGDAAYVSAYAASLDHPDAFVNDPMFNDPGNFGYYISLQVPLIRLLTFFTSSYGASYVILIIPFVLIQLFGFFILGRVLFRSRFYALLLALLSTLIFNAQSSDYWGVWYDPQPRMMFQSLFPWLLTLVVLSIQKPVFRWLVFVGLGFMIYVHPVSIPAVAFCIWLGYLVLKPVGLSWMRHLINQLGLGVIFIIFTIPFLFQYLGNRDISPSTSLGYQTAVDFLKEIIPSTFELHITQAMFLQGLFFSGLVLLAYFGATIIYRFESERRTLGLILLWLGGIILVCIGLSTIEQQIEFKLRTIPILVQITRGLRYMIPLLEVLVLWPLALAWRHTSSSSEIAVIRRLGLAILGIAILIFFSRTFPQTYDFPIPDYRFNSINCFIKGQLTCTNQNQLDKVSIIEFIQNKTPDDSLFISIPPTDIGGAVRFEGLRSVAFDPNDRNRIALGDLAGAIAMNKANVEWDQISNQPANQRMRDYFEFSRKMGADYVVIQSPAPDWLHDNEIYSNSTYTLITLDSFFEH